jgi:hypothetical protein
VALRLQLSLDLPLSAPQSWRVGNCCQFWDVRNHVRFGSVAVVQTNSKQMSGLGWKADTRRGRMSALTNTGRSEVLKPPNLNVR